MTVILVINSGSSSLKYSLIDTATEVPLASGLIERIGQPLICRRMGWPGYDAAASQAIADRLVANMRAALGVGT